MQRPRVDTVAVGSYTEQLFRKQLGSIRNYIMYTYKSVSSQNKRMSLLPQYRLGADARSIVSTDPGGTEPLLHAGRRARHPDIRRPPIKWLDGFCLFAFKRTPLMIATPVKTTSLRLPCSSSSQTYCSSPRPAASMCESMFAHKGDDLKLSAR